MSRLAGTLESRAHQQASACSTRFSLSRARAHESRPSRERVTISWIAPTRSLSLSLSLFCGCAQETFFFAARNCGCGSRNSASFSRERASPEFWTDARERGSQRLLSRAVSWSCVCVRIHTLENAALCR